MKTCLFTSAAALLAFQTIILVGCEPKHGKESGNARSKLADEPTTDSSAQDGFETRLLEIAQSYQTFHRVNFDYRWAPVNCAHYTAFMLAGAPRMSVSNSADSATHGRKIYALFAKDMIDKTYYEEHGPNPVGQVLVKEAWVPEDVTDTGERVQAVTRMITVRHEGVEKKQEDRYVPFAQCDGRTYHAKEKASLFVMYKLDSQTPATDLGWVYGTLTADGKTVTSSGRVESCMNCHKDAPHDRLFGLPLPAHLN